MSATDGPKIKYEFDVRFILEDYDGLAAATDVLDQLLRTLKSEAKIQQPRIVTATEVHVYDD